MHDYSTGRDSSVSSQENNQTQNEKPSVRKKGSPQKSQLSPHNPSSSLPLKKAPEAPSSSIQVGKRNYKVKSRVVKKICEDLIKRLKKKGYSSLSELLHKYKQEESKIYNLLLSMEGKGRKWGLFALGCFEWDENHYRAALNHWQKIDHPDPSNQALQEIQEVLSRRESSAVEKLIPEISSILEYHSRKNNRALLLRLVKFGGWENRKN